MLLSFTPDGVGNLLPLDDFLDIVTRMVIVFGLAFELPLLLVMLNFGGRRLTGRRMLGWWRGMVMGITVFARRRHPHHRPARRCCALAGTDRACCTSCAVGFSLLNDRRRRRKDPDAGLDDDEASELDLAPEAVGEVETVSASRRAARADGHATGRRRRRPTGLNGYDDVDLSSHPTRTGRRAA